MFVFAALFSVAGFGQRASTPGIALYDEGRISAAVITLRAESTSASGKKNPDIFNILGLSLVKLGDFPSAVGPFERAVKLRPGDATMRTNLAFAYIKSGQSAKVIGHLSRAIKIDGTNVNAYLLRARAYTNTGRFKPAEADFERVAELAPVSATGLALRAELHYMIAAYQDAPLSKTAERLRLAADTLGVAVTQCADAAECDGLKLRLEGLRLLVQFVDKKLEPNPDEPIGSIPTALEPGITDLKLLFKPRASYNDSARMRGIQGTVSLAAVFGADGSVLYAVPLKRLRYGLDESALNVVRQMIFEPRRENGVPVTIVRLVEYNFALY